MNSGMVAEALVRTFLTHRFESPCIYGPIDIHGPGRLEKFEIDGFWPELNLLIEVKRKFTSKRDQGKINDEGNVSFKGLGECKDQIARSVNMLHWMGFTVERTHIVLVNDFRTDDASVASFLERKSRVFRVQQEEIGHWF